MIYAAIVGQTGHVSQVNRFGILLGVVVIVACLVLAPMPLAVQLQNPNRSVVIYPNLLFVVPLLLLGVLLLLYGAAAKKS